MSSISVVRVTVYLVEYNRLSEGRNMALGVTVDVTASYTTEPLTEVVPLFSINVELFIVDAAIFSLNRAVIIDVTGILVASDDGVNEVISIYGRTSSLPAYSIVIIPAGVVSPAVTTTPLISPRHAIMPPVTVPVIFII